MKKSLIIFIGFFLLGVLRLHGQVPFNVALQDLVGWWPLDGNANDMTGNNLNGIITGATPTTDRYGLANSAYSFDGVNDFIQIAHQNLLSIPGSFTISAWVRPSSLPPPALMVKGIVSKGSWGESHGGDHNYFLTLHNHSGWSSQTSFGVGYENSNATNYILSSATNISVIDNWILMVGVFDQSIQTLTIFLNDVQSGSFSMATGTPHTSTQPLLFGAFYTNPASAQSSSFFHGSIDDVGLWSRALAREEIHDLYAECRIGFTNQPSNQSVPIGQSATFAAYSPDINLSYQWQLYNGTVFTNLVDGGQYQGSQTNTLTISNVTPQNDNQIYRCQITRDTCLSNSLVGLLTVIPSSGIEDVEEKQSVVIFPNPGSGSVRIAGLKDTRFHFRIIDASGKTIQEGEQLEKFIQLENHSSGIYSIIIRQESAVFTELIVIE